VWRARDNPLMAGVRLSWQDQQASCSIPQICTAECMAAGLHNGHRVVLSILLDKPALVLFGGKALAGSVYQVASSCQPEMPFIAVSPQLHHG